MSEPRGPDEPRRRRPMARPIARPTGPQRGTVSRLDLASGQRRPPSPPPSEDERYGRLDPHAAVDRGRTGRDTALGTSFAPNGAVSADGRGGRLGARLLVLLALVALAGAVVVAGLTLARPALGNLARSMAESNPRTLTLPFVADLVRGELGSQLTDPAGTDASPIDFVVPSGATARDVADMLTTQGLISDPLVFEFLTITGGESGTIRAGDYTLTKLMTPQQILARLQQPPEVPITLALRSGLRIEQITAYLETRGLGATVPKDFYDLAEHPTAALRADYPFLAALPAGNSLEGFLGGSTWQVKATVTGEDIVRHLLSAWASDMGTAIVAKAEQDGPAFYKTLILASIVQQEAALDSERAKIAGVYTNRLNPKIWSTGLLNADPTVFYANDSVQLADLPFAQWQTFYFWKPVSIALKAVKVPTSLISFQTYLHAGLPDWPICSPNQASVQAALAPDTSGTYLYFVAKNDGSDSHAFARTAAEFDQLLRKYGYIK
jgi:peptidoglycan lytic transglycosylase G